MSFSVSPSCPIVEVTATLTSPGRFFASATSSPSVLYGESATTPMAPGSVIMLNTKLSFSCPYGAFSATEEISIALGAKPMEYPSGLAFARADQPMRPLAPSLYVTMMPCFQPSIFWILSASLRIYASWMEPGENA